MRMGEEGRGGEGRAGWLAGRLAVGVWWVGECEEEGQRSRLE